MNKITLVPFSFLFLLIFTITTVQAIAKPEKIILADFESKGDVANEVTINAEYQLSSDHVASGNHSLNVTYTVKSERPGIWLKLKVNDWAPFSYFKMDIFNPLERRVKVEFIFSDNKTHDWSSHCQDYVYLESGKNTVKIDLSGIRRIKSETNEDKYLNLKNVTNVFFKPVYPFPYEEPAQTLYIDYIRIETKEFTEKVEKESSSIIGQKKELANNAYEDLKKIIDQAKEKGIETAYYEVTSQTARVGLLRLGLPEFNKTVMSNQTNIYDYIVSSCSQASNRLREILQGKKEERRVIPPPPKYSDLKREGSYFYLNGEPVLIFSMRGNCFPNSNRFFDPIDWQINSNTVFSTGGFWWPDEWLHGIGLEIRKWLKEHNEAWGVGIDGERHMIPPCIENSEFLDLLKKYITESSEKWKINPDILAHTFGYELGYICYCNKSKEMFQGWLKEKYGNLSKINEDWGTNYTDINQIKPPADLTNIDKDNVKRAIWYDWGTFNQDRYTGHIKWVKSITKEIDPDTPVCTFGHQCFDILGAQYPVRGIDTESLVELSDVVNTEGGRPILTDLLRSFSDGEKPIADFEYHGTISDILPHYLHGVRAMAMWVWGEDYKYEGRNIPRSPETLLPEVAECLRSALDIHRLGKYIVQFPQAKRDIALLYFRTSMLQSALPYAKSGDWSMHTPYLIALHRAYAATNFLDTYQEFITEKHIEQGKASKYKILIIPGVSHVRTPVFQKILDYVKNGGTLVITPISFVYDEYHHKTDYLKKLGITVKEINEPPVEKIKAGDWPTDILYLKAYFINSGIWNKPPLHLKPLSKDIFSKNKIDLQSQGIVQKISVDPENEVIATYPDNSPAIAIIRYGEGKIYYLACDLTLRSLGEVIDLIVEKTGIERPIRFVDQHRENLWGVEGRTVKYNGGYLFYLTNFENENKDVYLKTNLPIRDFMELRAMKLYEGKKITLGPRETKIFITQAP